MSTDFFSLFSVDVSAKRRSQHRRWRLRVRIGVLLLLLLCSFVDLQSIFLQSNIAPLLRKNAKLRHFVRTNLRLWRNFFSHTVLRRRRRRRTTASARLSRELVRLAHIDFVTCCCLISTDFRCSFSLCRQFAISHVLRCLWRRSKRTARRRRAGERTAVCARHDDDRLRRRRSEVRRPTTFVAGDVVVLSMFCCRFAMTTLSCNNVSQCEHCDVLVHCDGQRQHRAIDHVSAKRQSAHDLRVACTEIQSQTYFHFKKNEYYLFET